MNRDSKSCRIQIKGAFLGSRFFSALASQTPHSISAIETREWWPLLTVETDLNGDSKSANERGPSLVRVFFALASLVCPVQFIKNAVAFLSIKKKIGKNTIYFFPCHTLFQLICSGSWEGSRAESPVSMYVSLISATMAPTSLSLSISALFIAGTFMLAHVPWEEIWNRIIRLPNFVVFFLSTVPFSDDIWINTNTAVTVG